MLLVLILNSPNPYESRTEIKVPGVDHTKEEDGNLVAFNSSVEEVARFKREDVRNYHLEED